MVILANGHKGVAEELSPYCEKYLVWMSGKGTISAKDRMFLGSRIRALGTAHPQVSHFSEVSQGL